MKNKLMIILFLIGFGVLINKQCIKADSNMDGGGSGGGTQAGTSQNFYSSGDDGVRITVIDVKTKCRAEGTRTIDYYRLDKEGKDIKHFGKICKMEYMGVGGYTESRNFAQSSQKYLVNSSGQKVAYQINDLPTIVSSSSGNSDIEEIKNYFNNEDRLRGIASRTGIAYTEMINGNYKIIIEPVIYLTFQGKYIAMTAHEAAKLDMAMGGTTTSGGALRAKFVSFTHKNLPLSIFLEKKDLGVKPWTGSRYSRVQNGSILSYLGIGILSFAPQGNEVDLDGGSYVYRPNTDVITSVDVSVTDGDPDGASCDSPITVRFTGQYISTTYVTGVTIPQGGSRPVWIKWRTPDTSERIATTITAKITKGGMDTATVSIPVVIKPLTVKEPTNPTADDKKPRTWTGNASPSFPTTAVLSSFSSPVTQRSWHTYTCTKRLVLDYYYEDYEGNYIPVYKTVYNYTVNNYQARLSNTEVKVTRDRNTSDANPNSNRTKSGYGIEVKVKSNVTGSSSSCTGVQSFCAYFPEFNYKKWRRDGKLPGAAMLSTVELPVNLYSIKGNRVHFTPIWYPDGDYKVYVETFDAWTPGGMLCGTGTGSIEIKGTMWDDWHVQTVRN